MSGKVGYPPKIEDQEIVQKLEAAQRVGLSYKRGAELAGIHPDTYRIWRRRGEAELERVSENSRRKVYKNEIPYVELVEKLERAKGEAEFTLAGKLDGLAKVGGKEVVTTITKRFLAGEKEPYDTINQTKTKQLPPSESAIKFILSRRYPETWGSVPSFDLSRVIPYLSDNELRLLEEGVDPIEIITRRFETESNISE